MRTVWHYCIIALPLVFAFSMLGTITDSILTKAVPSSDTGKAHQRDQTGLFPLPLLFYFGPIRHFPAHAPAHHSGCPIPQQIWLQQLCVVGVSGGVSE